MTKLTVQIDLEAKDIDEDRLPSLVAHLKRYFSEGAQTTGVTAFFRYKGIRVFAKEDDDPANQEHPLERTSPPLRTNQSTMDARDGKTLQDKQERIAYFPVAKSPDSPSEGQG